MVDVANAGAIAGLPDEISASHGRLTVLVNNAGVALGGLFEQVSLEDFEWLITINFLGVVRMTKAFLPMLRQEPSASIVNISSIFGIIAPPSQAAYCASKFAVRGFSESLRHELQGSNIAVTVVHPGGGIATSIARNARLPKGATQQQATHELKQIEKMMTLSPDAAASAIVTGIRRRRPRVMIGRDAKGADFIQRVFPVRYFSILRRLQ